MTNNVQINHEAMTITISKKFAQKAGKFGTPEYRQFIEMKKDNEGYRVIVKSIPSNSGAINRITLEDMKKYILAHDDEEGTGMKAFEAKLAEEVDEDCQHKNFFRIRKWFFEQYKEIKEDKKNVA